MALKDRKILYWLLDGDATEEQREEGESVGAQFRNARFADPDVPEDCDYVMGDVPAGYENTPVFKAKASNALVGSTDSHTAGNGPRSGAQADSGLYETRDGEELDENGEEEIEITASYIKSLRKDLLIELASEEELTLTGEETVPELKEILLDHFDLQE